MRPNPYLKQVHCNRPKSITKIKWADGTRNVIVRKPSLKILVSFLKKD